MPRGILASLGICTVLYVAAALVLTGMIPYGKLVGVADPLAAGFAYVRPGLGGGPPRVRGRHRPDLRPPRLPARPAAHPDGDVAGRPPLPWFSKIHPRFRTPHVTTILTGVFVAVFAAVANIDEIVQLTNIGTLFAFILVAIGILVLRAREPERPRKFRVPFSPVTPVLGILMCLFLMQGLPGITWIRFASGFSSARPLLRLRNAAEPPQPPVAGSRERPGHLETASGRPSAR